VQRYGGKIFSAIPHLWYFFDVAKIAAKNKRFLRIEILFPLDKEKMTMIVYKVMYRGKAKFPHKKWYTTRSLIWLRLRRHGWLVKQHLTKRLFSPDEILFSPDEILFSPDENLFSSR